ncbi:MAG: hypothetical protein M1819_001693 [Sarea resinae]|nr:MAG: hypothetical protein M1819_001693 [Sarea resinae]
MAHSHCAHCGPLELVELEASTSQSLSSSAQQIPSSSKRLQRRTIYAGRFIHCKTRAELDICERGAIGVDENGVIVFVEREVGGDAGVGAGAGWEQGLGDVIAQYGWEEPEKHGHEHKHEEEKGAGAGKKVKGVRVVFAPENGFFFPGFVDTHIHASQYANLGLFGNTTLLSWLERYTFPLEASLSSPPKAHSVYSRCIARTLAHGTTTAAYFATAHTGSTNHLAKLCLRYGQRALVGRCNMDRLSPEWYLDASVEESVQGTRDSIAFIQALDPPTTTSRSSRPTNLLTPILTPRFAPSCTGPLLSALGALAQETHLPIQTHVSENAPEIALVLSQFPTHASYTAVYDACQILTPRTILAHGVHLSAAELGLIATRGAKIAHCPASNTALTSGRARVRDWLDAGVEVGLGTDVSGGWSPSVLDAVRGAMAVSRCVAMDEPDRVTTTTPEDAPSSTLQEDEDDDDDDAEDEERQQERDERRKNHPKLSLAETLYLATRGGAHVVGLGDRVGGFDVGKEWDAQMVSLGRVVGGEDDSVITSSSSSTDITPEDSSTDPIPPEIKHDGNVDVFGFETWPERVAKWVFAGDDRNTAAVWVRGRLVSRRRGWAL